MSLRPSNHSLQADGLCAHDLIALMPKHMKIKEGGLELAGVDLELLAKTEGTALYVYDEQMLHDQLRSYQQALALYRGPAAQTVYASKAFSCKAMIKLVQEEAAYLDVSSGGELALALAAGFDPAHILVHGNNKTPQEITEALEAGVGRFVVDTRTELIRINELASKLNCVAQVLLRIAPGVVADTHSYIQTGAEDSKFGFTMKEGIAQSAVELALRLEHIELMGYHMHIGSQIFDFSPFAEAVKLMAQFSADMNELYSYSPQELDCGGGLGVAYTHADKPGRIQDLCALVIEALETSFSQHNLALPKLYLEPGRSIVANAACTLYTVGSVKEIPGVRTYVNIDGGMTDNIRTCLYEAQYEALVVNKADKPRDCIITLAGKHCESGDVVLIDSSLQQAQAGDIVAVFTTGAYNDSMASNYNMQVRPAVIFVKDGSYRVVKRRESYEDLFIRDLG